MRNPFKPSTFRLLCAAAASLVVHAAVSFAPFLGDSRDAVIAASPKAGNLSTLRLINIEAPASVSVHTTSAAQDPIASIQQPKTTSFESKSILPLPKTVGEALLPIDGATYFPPSQLSRPPEPALPVPLDSSELGQLPRGGRAILTIWIDSRGNVVETRVESSDVPERFVRFAEEAFRKAPFVPGELNGRPVGAVMRIEVRYDDLTDPPG